MSDAKKLLDAFAVVKETDYFFTEQNLQTLRTVFSDLHNTEEVMTPAEWAVYMNKLRHQLLRNVMQELDNYVKEIKEGKC